MVIGSFYSKPQLLSTLLSQIPWHAAEHKAIYSAYVVERAITSCFLEFQDTPPEARLNVAPVVLFLSSKHFPQSLSKYPSSLLAPVFLYHTPKSTILARYLSILYPAPMCYLVGWFINLDSTPITNDMSGLEWVKYIRCPTKLLYLLRPASSEWSSACSFSFEFRDVGIDLRC